MNDNRNNTDSERSKEDLKAWMDSHPQEYGEVAMGMGEADLFSVFLMAQAAFIASPEFQKRLEDMIDTDNRSCRIGYGSSENKVEGGGNISHLVTGGSMAFHGLKHWCGTEIHRCINLRDFRRESGLPVG